MKAKRIEFVNHFLFPGSIQLSKLENVEFDVVRGLAISLTMEEDGELEEHVIPIGAIRRIVLTGDNIGAFDVEQVVKRMTLDEGAAKLKEANEASSVGTRAHPGSARSA